MDWKVGYFVCAFPISRSAASSSVDPPKRWTYYPLRFHSIVSSDDAHLCNVVAVAATATTKTCHEHGFWTSTSMSTSSNGRSRLTSAAGYGIELDELDDAMPPVLDFIRFIAFDGPVMCDGWFNFERKQCPLVVRKTDTHNCFLLVCETTDEGLVDCDQTYVADAVVLFQSLDKEKTL